MMKIIAAAAFLAAPWQPAHAQAIVGSIPEEFRGDWCQENTKDNIFKPGGCKLKAGSLSIDRMTLDKGQLSRLSQAIPPTLQQSLMARLDRLGPAREVAQIGSVIGRGFSCKF
jgi:hypothetical protein